jgi:AraC-like DNA-binding protein
MNDALTSLEILARGISLACLLLLFFRTVYVYRALPAGRFFAVFSVSLAAYVLVPLLPDAPAVDYPVVAIAIAIPPAFWLFCDSLFNDASASQRRALLTMVAVFVFMVLCLASYALVEGTPDNTTEKILFYAAYAGRLTFVALAIRAIVSNWQDDLVASRRSLRGLFLASSASYITIVMLVEISLANRLQPALLETGNAVLMALVLLAVCSWFLVAAPSELFPVPSTVSKAKGPDSGALSHTEQTWLGALRHAMQGEHAYRRADLSIRTLSDELNIPEHLLRRLINQRLGYRNFRHYLNHFRLEEVAARLKNPEDERLPVLTIALDAGFASITPFNRAFRDAFGITPTEFRKSPPLPR